MEVHHKHHIPKKWKEYITEFLMLFTAVTLGFFAENYREHSLVEKKMHENYGALVQDLEADSVFMSRILEKREEGNKAMYSLKYLLYQYHQKQINADELITGFKNIPTLPTYITVFINNTTFKNIQSSGMLSYISSKELRFQISYYYEVFFKRLQDNNAIFDKDGMEFFDKNLPFSHGAFYRVAGHKSAYSEVPDQGYADADRYFDFLLHLEESKKILQSEKLIYQCETYHQRYINYTDLIATIMERNNKLLKELRKVYAE
ncbi:MAG: DUF6090 family protein [Sphingobacteriaceae bacterium]